MEWVSAIQRKQSSLEIDVEDTAHLVLGFAHARRSARHRRFEYGLHPLRHHPDLYGYRYGFTALEYLTGTVEIFEQGGNAWQTFYASTSKG